jgi:hypothetical protein
LNGTGAALGGGEEIRLALQQALHATFMVMMLIAVLIVPACLLVPQQQAPQAEPKSA